MMTSLTGFLAATARLARNIKGMFFLFFDLWPETGENLTRVTHHKNKSHLYDRFSQKDHLIEKCAKSSEKTLEQVEEKVNCPPPPSLKSD